MHKILVEKKATENIYLQLAMTKDKGNEGRNNGYAAAEGRRGGEQGESM